MVASPPGNFVRRPLHENPFPQALAAGAGGKGYAFGTPWVTMDGMEAVRLWVVP
jgi:hypothetical protein